MLYLFGNKEDVCYYWIFFIADGCLLHRWLTISFSIAFINCVAFYYSTGNKGPAWK